MDVVATALLLSPATESGPVLPRTAVPGEVSASLDSNQRPLRVLGFLEASTIAGAVKPVLEFAREAARSSNSGAVELTMVLYVRARQAGGLLDVIRAEGIPLEVVTEGHAFDLRVVPQLRAIAARLRPHIVWTNNIKSHFLVYLSGLHRTARWIAFHHGYTQEAWRTKVYNQLDRWSLRHAERVVTVCNSFARELQQKGVPANRLVVQRNPIRVSSPASEAEKIQLRAQLALPNNASVLLSIGRLSREKGHADLLRAMARMRAAEVETFRSCLLIVGDGPERRRLQALCSALQLDDVVRFTDHQADVRPYYGIAHLFVLPSHSEGSPNVLLEAMAAGVPMVATAVGGVPEVLSHEVNALLVPKQDVAQLATAIRRLLNDPQLRQQFTDKGKEVVSQHDPHSYFQSLVDIFQEVMSETRAA